LAAAGAWSLQEALLLAWISLLFLFSPGDALFSSWEGISSLQEVPAFLPKDLPQITYTPRRPSPAIVFRLLPNISNTINRNDLQAKPQLFLSARVS
jgi:hypothetical protein